MISHPTQSVAACTGVESVLRGEASRPQPLFLPAIYEHKAWFIGSTPSADILAVRQACADAA